MPLLAAFLAVAFGKLADFFVQFFSQRIAFQLAVAALVVAAYATLYVTLQLLISSFAVTMPTALATAITFAFPSNTVACITAAIACDCAFAGYRIYLIGLTNG